MIGAAFKKRQDLKEEYIETEINGYYFKIDKKFYDSLKCRQAKLFETEEKKVEFTRVVLEYELIPQPGYPPIPKNSTGKYIDLNSVKTLEELEKTVRKNFKEPPWSRKKYIVTEHKLVMNKEEKII